MKIHPLCLLIPDLRPDEYDRLKADMAANGYDERFPIIVFDGAILDGRHRYNAAHELGLNPAAEEFKGTEAEAARLLLRSINRRDLTAGQRAMIGAGLELHFAERAKGRQRDVGGAKTAVAASQSALGKIAQSVSPPKRARDEAAKAAGVSGRSVQDAKFVAYKSPELAAKVKAGTVSLSAANKQIRQGPPPPKPKPAPPPKVRDETGRIITDPDVIEALSHRGVIEGKVTLKGLINKTNALRREIEAIYPDPISRRLDHQEITRTLKRIAYLIDYGMPHAECHAARDHKTCKTCDGFRWVDRARWEMRNKELWA